VHHIFDCSSFSDPVGVYNDQTISIQENDSLYIKIFPSIGTDFTINACQDSTNNLDVYAQYYVWEFPNYTIADSISCSITLSSLDQNVPDDMPLRFIISNALCSDTTEFTTIIPVEEIDATQHIQVYPNPFNNYCNVVFTERFNSIVLYNTLGEIVQSWSNQPTSITIDRKQLKSGAYYLVAHSEHRTGKKIIIAE
jgi:hypothetical protein